MSSGGSDESGLQPNPVLGGQSIAFPAGNLQSSVGDSGAAGRPSLGSFTGQGASPGCPGEKVAACLGGEGALQREQKPPPPSRPQESCAWGSLERADTQDQTPARPGLVGQYWPPTVCGLTWQCHEARPDALGPFCWQPAELRLLQDTQETDPALRECAFGLG